MKNISRFFYKKFYNHYFFITYVILTASLFSGCKPRPGIEVLKAVKYAPLPGDDWKFSTPEEQGLDSNLVAELYFNASRLETIYSLLIVKNGYLIAEKYFNKGSVTQESTRQSTTKSFTSAFVGLALEQGCLSSLDLKMMEFFPEFEDQIRDPRKAEITIRDLLQMRAGFPWEESSTELFKMLYKGLLASDLSRIPLTKDPGTTFQYSNFSSNLLAIIVARACNTDLRSFSDKHLFSHLGVEVGDWWTDEDGYYYGMSGIHLTSREMAKFGLLYLNDGMYNEKQVLSADWIKETLKSYSDVVYFTGGRKKGSYFDNLGYGYQWWSARIDDIPFFYASGHGGQYIVLLDELNMIIVTTADPFHGKHGGKAWRHEKAITNLVGKFIQSLPSK